MAAGGFEKVIKMIDDMVQLLKDEQVADDNKKEYCLTQFDNTDDKKKALERKLGQVNTGIAGTGVTALSQVAPPPPPATWDAYAKKSGESTGVIAMIDLLVKDLTKEMTEGKTAEADAQADYENMMRDSAEKR